MSFYFVLIISSDSFLYFSYFSQFMYENINYHDFRCSWVQGLFWEIRACVRRYGKKAIWSPVKGHYYDNYEFSPAIFPNLGYLIGISSTFHKKNISEYWLFQIEIIFYLNLVYCSISCIEKIVNGNFELLNSAISIWDALHDLVPFIQF